jgi:hypothetical protein
MCICFGAIVRWNRVFIPYTVYVRRIQSKNASKHTVYEYIISKSASIIYIQLYMCRPGHLRHAHCCLHCVRHMCPHNACTMNADGKQSSLLTCSDRVVPNVHTHPCANAHYSELCTRIFLHTPYLCVHASVNTVTHSSWNCIFETGH